MPKKKRQPKFAVCVANEGCDDLQVWKLYRVLPDAKASAEGYLRVEDDSGEDYLYPASRFLGVDFTAEKEEMLLAAASSSDNRRRR